MQNTPLKQSQKYTKFMNIQANTGNAIYYFKCIENHTIKAEN